MSVRREGLRFVRHRWNKPLETFHHWLQQAERIGWLFFQGVHFELSRLRTKEAFQLLSLCDLQQILQLIGIQPFVVLAQLSNMY
jgi:hypothetical protein